MPPANSSFPSDERSSQCPQESPESGTNETSRVQLACRERCRSEDRVTARPQSKALETPLDCDQELGAPRDEARVEQLSRRARGDHLAPVNEVEDVQCSRAFAASEQATHVARSSFKTRQVGRFVHVN